MYIIPSIEELEQKVQAKFWKQLNIVVKEAIYFRMFGIDMIIPQWFVSDWASLWIFKWFIDSYNPKWVFAALVHDYIYRTQFLPRDIADSIFREILKITAGTLITYSFYKWVDWFWLKAWKNNQKKWLEKYPKAKHNLRKHICWNFQEG